MREPSTLDASPASEADLPPELLYLLTAFLPGLWGWGMYWLLNRVWPLGDLAVEHHDVPSRAPVDYQI